jgi:hypothetical protein
MMKPTPEQFAEWLAQAMEGRPAGELKTNPGFVAGEVARLAYAAGADAQLEKCLKALREDVLTKENLFGAGISSVNGYSWQEFARMVCIQLRSTCRPEPPGRKQQALAELERLGTSETAAIRRAIESLPDD